MKYILIEHSDGAEPKQVHIFDTVDARAIATREAILGPPTASNKDTNCPEFLELASCGIAHFEGDPPLEWVDAEVRFSDPRIIELCERLTSSGSIHEKLSASELHEICNWIFALAEPAK
jgi:hypothetical protein